MPTIILFDVSLSMTRPVQISENSETTRKQLAVNGLNTFLDHLSVHSKLEFISLVSSYSNTFMKFTLLFLFLKISLKPLVIYLVTNQLI